MEVLILSVIGMLVFFVILYFVVKAAVREGIWEARHIELSDKQEAGDGSGISQVICARCGNKYDMDYPKCPYCKHPG